jgi:hypothetical protein
MGVAPVVLSDDWYRPSGPDWDAFSLWIPEASCLELPELLSAAGDRWIEMGRAAREAYERFFSEDTVFDQLVLAMELLLHCAHRPSTASTLLRQAWDLAWQLVGLPSPVVARSRSVGRTALSSRSVRMRGGRRHD